MVKIEMLAIWRIFSYELTSPSLVYGFTCTSYNLKIKTTWKKKIIKKLWFSSWKQNDTGKDSCVWDWNGEKCYGSVVDYDITIHLYLLWNIWYKCFTCTRYNLKMKITWNKRAKYGENNMKQTCQIWKCLQ